MSVGKVEFEEAQAAAKNMPAHSSCFQVHPSTHEQPPWVSLSAQT